MARKLMLIIGAVFLLLLSTPLIAQNGAVREAVLEYADDEYELSAIDQDGKDKGDIYLGDRFEEGDSIRTRSTGAEIRLQPNGTIIKIAPETTFRFNSFHSRTGSGTNEFSVYAGKVRVVAARIRGSNYQIRTPTTVTGVRGTDFTVEVQVGQREAIIVRTGKVEVYSKSLKTSVLVNEGQFTDAVDEDFIAEEWDDWDEGLD
ncbi:MAG: FecR domain-containing protein, partial [Spirochaetales bacterium]|nr:FecR domain-containing protein [Spirochaetales bacterium]